MGQEVTSDAIIRQLTSDLCSIGNSVEKQNLEPEEVRQLVLEIAEKRLYKEFQGRTLKVSVGGFIVVNPSTLDLIPLFSKGSGEPSFYLPYFWNAISATSFEPVINDMFIVWRASESLKAHLEEDKFPPEYYYYLPSSTLSKKQQKSSRLHPWEIEYRNRQQCHYVTLGEVLFFLVAWRLLLRIAQSEATSVTHFINANGSTNTEKTIVHSKGTILWDNMDRMGDSVRENMWINFANAADYKHRDKWTQLSQLCDVNECPLESFMNDLIQLRLLKESGNRIERKEFKPLLKYLEFFINGAPRKQRTILKDKYDSFTGSSTWMSKTRLENIITLILYVFGNIIDDVDLAENLSAKSASENLKKLHQVARFPIIPYFYWCVVDKIPKAHLVLPIWQSYSTRAKVRSFDANYRTMIYHSYEPAYAEGGGEIFMNTVGVAVIGAAPIFGLDWTVFGHETYMPQIESAKRLELVEHFYRLYAMPVIDQAYYRRLADEEVLRQRQEAMVETAKNVQTSLMSIAIAEETDYEVKGNLEQCDKVGGDFYSVYTLTNKHVCIVLGDVSGHGLGAALMASNISACLRILTASWHTDLVTAVTYLHKDLLSLKNGTYATLFIGVLSIETNELEYINAGHQARPIMVRSNGSIEKLDCTGFAPGWDLDKTWHKKHIAFGPGDLLFLCTDGLTEMTDESEQQVAPFCEEELEKFLATNHHKDMDGILQLAMSQAKEFRDKFVDEVKRDDICMLAVRRSRDK